MSRWFVQPEEGIGPGGDIVFSKHATGWKVMVGDTYFGMVFHLGRSWSAVSDKDESEFFLLRSMDGFATRLTAASFVIRHHGYWMRDERMHHRSEESTR